ncbi:hypothetical protein [Asanoa iriomotensis]|uniref:Uncharacterized protein n=1 Tax=Asanoa iriomotensis TaxID=234613 RepID=A0ABQ4CBR5_9ACTN|nr:hypothetical protein [Asanoa iriomotensis]GIF60219.1 hypothetical protein Air01nite_63140 [Asanoa iriomotensis]
MSTVSPKQIEEWTRIYREHSRDPEDRHRCMGCIRLWPCRDRIEVAELLVMNGVNVDPAGPTIQCVVCDHGSALEVPETGLPADRV